MSKTGPAHVLSKRRRRRRNTKNRCKMCRAGVYLSEYQPTHHYSIPGVGFVSVRCEMDTGEDE